jgi:hypothetical protein
MLRACFNKPGSTAQLCTAVTESEIAADRNRYEKGIASGTNEWDAA